MTNTTIGEQLRRARLTQNLDLSQIADDTKISKYYLDAIESNQIERLPGLFFYKAFVRQYCNYLKLDSKKLESQINAEQGSPDLTLAEIRQSRIPASQREPALRAANLPGGDHRMVFAAFGLIAVLVGGSVVYTWMQRPAVAIVSEAKPAESLSAVSRPAAQPSTPAVISAPQQQQAQLQTAPASAAIRQVTDNLTPEAGPGSNVALSLSATEATWIAITSDGKTIFSGMLEAQQSKQLMGKQQVVIKVGNAAGLEVKWNGKPVGRLGDSRQVRTILFTDKDYQIVAPPPPSTTPSNPVSL